MKYTWLRPSKPLITGRHTEEICAKIDKAVENYKKGISSYLHIVVPFRHGKSDISSRYFPPYFLGHFPDMEVIQASYGATLSEGFSKDVKKCVQSDKYKRLFNTKFDSSSNNASERHVKGQTGKYFAVGADGGATGKGADLLIIDDFFKNRSEAESETTRSKRWESFTQDFLSRCLQFTSYLYLILVGMLRTYLETYLRGMISRTRITKRIFPCLTIFTSRQLKTMEHIFSPSVLTQAGIGDKKLHWVRMVLLH